MHPGKLTPLLPPDTELETINHDFPLLFCFAAKSAERPDFTLWPMTHLGAKPGCGLQELGKINKTAVRIRSLMFDLHPESAPGKGGGGGGVGERVCTLMQPPEELIENRERSKRGGGGLCGTPLQNHRECMCGISE